MKLSGQRMPNWVVVFCCSAALFLSLGVNQLAQTTQQVPPPTGHVNDFAGVVNEQTRQQLENILANLKLKTGIEFDIATVESTGGQDISDFSLQVARDWNIGTRTSAKKSLLLVVAVNERTSFTRFSRSVQNDLPEGVLGEMGQRMRALVDAGRFSEGLNAGVQHFVATLAEKLAFSTDDFDKAPAAPSAPTSISTDTPSVKPAAEAAPAITSSTKSETSVARVKPPAARNESVTSPTKRANTSATDDDDAEEVALTLTKPVAERVALLRAFLDEHPDSKSRAQATEYLVSSRAGLGDERLKKGDRTGGIEQLMLAIADAPVDASEKLFSGVISQIPLNLYLRGEPEAATKAAQNIETKFGNDPKRLVALSSFYISTEQGGEATRLTTQAVQLAPELAEAHHGLGRALHISLRLDEAAVEYKRALELDPNSKAARRSLADLNRAFGKGDEALALYRQLLEVEPTDKAARNGSILSLLELGRSEEAKAELNKAIEQDPRNLNLLAGAAYWFVAHNDSEQSLSLARKAVAIEPRYTWSQIALARALVADRQPLEAERALRFARQYGKFPTLDYELASVLVSAGLYDEAAEILMQSFNLKDDQIETRLAGQTVVHGTNFIELLAPERRASIFQFTAADTPNNAKLLKALLTFATSIDSDKVGTINEQNASAAAKEFASGDDAAVVHRQLYAARRLLQGGVGFQTAYELAEAARASAEAGMSVPALTLAVQADEFRSIRARAIASGATPDIPEAPRNVLSNLIRGRIEDTSGWALLNQDKLDEAVEHLKRAVAILPEGTPAAHTSLWHLGVALERQDKKSDALSYYIKSYNSGDPDPVRRAVIEQLYRKINGSLAGLDERIGAALATSMSAQTDNTTEKAPENSPATAPPATAEASPSPSSSPSSDLPAATPPTEQSPTPSATPASDSPSTGVPQSQAPSAQTPEPSPEATPTSSPDAPASAPPTPESSPATTPEATPEPTPTSPTEAPTSASPTPESSPVAAPESTPTPASTPSLDASPVEKMDKPPRTTIVITGRVKDSSGNPLANVVVVLISPLGTVLASTTDEQGNYSFTLAPSSSTRSYRIIPSKDGLTFEPIDKVLPVGIDDVKELDFVGTASQKP